MVQDFKKEAQYKFYFLVRKKYFIEVTDFPY